MAGVWTGRIMSALVVIFLLADAIVGLAKPELLRADMTATGFSASMLAPISLIAIVAALLYAIPHTALLGAIVITGFLGGAICTHFRVGEMGSPPQIICLVAGLLTWGGLYLRDARLRAMSPVAV